jgi:hypothetical protein
MTPARTKPLALKEPEGAAPIPMLPQVMTPMDMIQTALTQNAGIEVLEKLMALQERHEKNQARKAFDEAIASAKAKIKPITKNRKVDFTSAKGRTNYEYEDLAEIARSVDPILAEFGLSYRFRSHQEGNRLSITCVMSHRDGYSEENVLSATNDESGNKNSIQAIGSTASYLQRYTLKLALGLAAAKDDDGKAASSPGTITAKQFNELDDLLTKTDAKRDAFNQMYKIEDLADLPVNKFEDARAKLLRKLKAKEEGHDPRTSD